MPEQMKGAAVVPQIDWTISIPNVVTVGAVCVAAFLKAHGAIIRGQLTQERHGDDIKAVREETQQMRQDLRLHTSREEAWQRETDTRVQATLSEIKTLQQELNTLRAEGRRR